MALSVALMSMLIQRGVRVLAANGDDLTDTSDPSRVMMRQLTGSFAQYEKVRVVRSSALLASAYAQRKANARAERTFWIVIPSWCAGEAIESQVTQGASKVASRDHARACCDWLRQQAGQTALRFQPPLKLGQAR